MNLELFRCENLYWSRLPGGVGSLEWRQQGEHWVCVKADVPVSAQTANIRDLPAGLQEEILALAARSEAMRGPEWGRLN